MPIKKALGHIITCKHATRLVSEKEERPLGVVDRVLLKLHLAWCVACVRFDRQIRFMREAIDRYR